MNMDRNRREAERKADCKTEEYLELKYETDIQRGLTLAKVRQKQRAYIYYKTKEKKRIWLMCLKQECQNPLFFFFVYLCMLSILFQFTPVMKTILCLSFVCFLFLKMRKTLRYSRILFRQKEMYGSKAVVLRENTFQCVQVTQLVKGDIVRLKREERVPLTVISIKPPYKEYKRGETFVENTGRAIVAQQEMPLSFKNTGKNKKKEEQENMERKKLGHVYMEKEKVPEKCGGDYARGAFLQELFIRQGIYFQPDFFKKMMAEEKNPIIAVGFEENYFPSEFQKERFQKFMKELKQTGTEWFFFTSQDKKRAFSIGKEMEIVEEKREVIDKKQFLLLKNVALEKQIKSIRIYCGLSQSEKSQVIAMWEKYHQTDYGKKQGRILFMSGLKQTDREKAERNCVYACCNRESKNSDVWFGKCWRDTMIKYLIGENLWLRCFKDATKWEKQILRSLCLFMFLSLLLALYVPKQGNMQWVLQAGSLFTALYIIGREIVQEGFRRWFLRKLNND